MTIFEERRSFEIYLADAEHPFSGWDFSHISSAKRMVTTPLDWSYTSIILPLVRTVDAMLDMGTGGGEFLASLQPLPRSTFATEGYPPNLPLARERLEPLGVEVRAVSDDSDLPFDDEQFDLVINRHESYDPVEVWRTVKPGGWLITQQVGGRNDLDLNRELGALEDFGFLHWDLDYAARELEGAGWRVEERREAFPILRFFDIGAVVYYLKAVPWQIEDFDVERYRDRLYALHQKITAAGYIDITSHYFLLVARKL